MLSAVVAAITRQAWFNRVQARHLLTLTMSPLGRVDFVTIHCMLIKRGRWHIPLRGAYNTYASIRKKRRRSGRPRVLYFSYWRSATRPTQAQLSCTSNNKRKTASSTVTCSRHLEGRPTIVSHPSPRCTIRHAGKATNAYYGYRRPQNETTWEM